MVVSSWIEDACWRGPEERDRVKKVFFNETSFRLPLFHHPQILVEEIPEMLLE